MAALFRNSFQCGACAWLLCWLLTRALRRGGFLSILYSIGSKPLQIWDKQVQNGHIKRLTDEDIQSSVLEVAGDNVRGPRAPGAPRSHACASCARGVSQRQPLCLQVATTFISCPADASAVLGIKMPFLVMIIKNMHKFFSFEVQARGGQRALLRLP